MSDPTVTTTIPPSVEQLSGVAVVIIIAVGVQGCIILFIFAKRQIMRFALRNKRGPHSHIAQGGPKMLRREIDRQLDYVPYIKHEPRVECRKYDAMNPSNKPKHYFRLKTMEQLRSFEYDIACYSVNYSRALGVNHRSHLLNCTNGPLLGVSTHLIHQICDDYEAARHHYDDYGPERYKVFIQRLSQLRDALQQNKAQKPQPSPMPISSSPKKRSKRHRQSTSSTVITGVDKGSETEILLHHRNSKTLLVSSDQFASGDKTDV